MSELKLTESNFDQEVLQSELPVVVDFFATWCGPCKVIAPILEEVAKEYEGKVKVCTVDVDEARPLAVKYNISNIPTLLFIKNGEIIDQNIGRIPKESLQALFNDLLQS